MKLITSLLLLSTGAIAAERYPKLGLRSPATLDQLYGSSSLESRQTLCDGDSQDCADTCIPLDAQCCDVTIGIYCEAGTSCTTSDTCTDDSSSGDGSSGGGGSLTCDDGLVLCGIGCIPDDGATCCDESLTTFCEAGFYCETSTTCLPDKKSSGNGSDSPSSSSSDSTSKDSSSSGSSGDSSDSSDSSDEEDAGISLSPSFFLIALGAAMVLF